jgi:hypothetical protein
MKNIILFFILAVFTFFMYSCEEVGPNINLNPPKIDTSLIDTTYIAATSETPQTKMILIEDFTGVRCPNCPTAAKKIEDLQTQYPNRIIACAIHFNNIFGIPHSGSKYDFRTASGLEIFNMLPGTHSQLPIGDVDRTLHTDGGGKLSVLQLYSTWPTFVDEQLSKNSVVNIDLSGGFIDTGSTYKIKVKLHYTQAAISDTQAISIYLIEDNIIDLQTLPTTAIDSHYVHKHVLRAVLTNNNGDDLKAGLVVNRVFEKDYKIELNKKWVRSNCSIIAFVHKKGSTFDVINVRQKSLQ